MRYIIVSLVVAFMMLVSTNLSAQYYNTGVDPASINWKEIATKNRRIIFPDYYETKARIYNAYMDTLTPYISNGLRNKIDKVDVILRTRQTMSNGVVTWAPKRMELYTTPPPGMYSMPWNKQLVAHEYRHVVQMSNLNVGFTHVLSWLIGEQAIGLIAAIPPRWFFEGDATLAETEFAFSGRGEQPEFSIGLRARLNEDKEITLYDKMSLGSFKDYTPSLYEYGYFMTSATRQYFGDDFWEKVLRYTARNPYFITSSSIAYQKYAQTSTPRIYYRTFQSLKQFWHNASQQPNSSEFLDVPVISYTTYTSPILLSENKILASKKDLDYVSRIVLFDKSSSEEHVLRQIPWVNSPIVLKDSMLYWCEFKPSMFWEQSVGSVIRSSRLKHNKSGELTVTRPQRCYGGGDVFFVTPACDSSFVIVEYDKFNNPQITHLNSNFEIINEFKFKGDANSFNGLAWDDLTQKVYYIIVDNSGTRIESLDLRSYERENITSPSYIALNKLTAKNGQLFFGSTESGKDELHTIDLTTKQQYRLTSSKYGSFDGVAQSDSSALFTTYRRDGYILAEQKYKIDTLPKVSSDKKMPEKILVPENPNWNTLKLDTVNITSTTVTENRKPSRRYRKTPHLFNIHSWMPFVLDLNKLMDDRELTIGAGVTALSQNTIGTMTSILGYGWVPSSQMSLLTASFKYTGLPVEMGLKVDYGGSYQDIYAFSGTSIYVPDIKKYLSVKVDLSLPFNFTGGSNFRRLTPYANLRHTNSMIFGAMGDLKHRSMQEVNAGLQYSSYRASTKKDLAPPLGYVVQLSTTSSPFNRGFATIYNAYARGYLPGFTRHHSLDLAVNYQFQNTNTYNYIKESLFPRGNDLLGVSESYVSTAAKYMFPVACTDWTIPDILNIRRISLGTFGEYASVNYANKSLNLDPNIYSYGLEALFDINILRMGIDFNIGISLYKASQHSNPSIGFSFNINY